MFKGIKAIVIALAPLVAAPAFAATTEAICSRAGVLATASEQLATLSAEHYGQLSSGAAGLQQTTQGFQAYTQSLEAGGGAVGETHPNEGSGELTPVAFDDVESAFWALAYQWNSDAYDLSQEAGTLDAYNHVVAAYRQLLFTVYDMPLDQEGGTTGGETGGETGGDVHP